MELLQWKILQAIPETNDTITYQLSADIAVDYEAGQFLTFLINYYGHEIRRSYSLSTVPGTDEHVSVTVKRRPNGEISRYIQDDWKPGTQVTSLPPAGRFTLATDPNLQRHIVFIAAGSGIVPVFALLKKVLQNEANSKATLIYQNNNEDSIIFSNTLELLKRSYGERFTRIDLLSNPKNPNILVRRLNNGLLESLLNQQPDLTLHERNIEFYLCGPAAFMRMAQFTLRMMGYLDEQVHKENFTIEYIPVPFFHLPPNAHHIVARYNNETFRFNASYPSTILQAALDNNIKLPYSCKAGVCSTCVAKCVQGAVKMSINEVLTEKDLAEGLVLTCVGYAVTDVELVFQP